MAKSLGQTAEFFRRMGEWRNQLRHAAPSANQSHFTASASHNHSEQSTFRSYLSDRVPIWNPERNGYAKT
ncbi:unnamed protein product [Cuscuta campestris]|uniref:Uncharacterized protein n=1 Tax=Cuscuta campestris TaxID=132261 RepID=A0A484KBQ1_9ASTE|nr:unnamed protein product [Cuscuta campestris]